MTQYTLYPRPMDVRRVLMWANEGDDLFFGYLRRDSMEAISACIQRLGLPPQYETLRRASLGSVGRPGRAPSQELLRGLLNNLRVHGYIYPAGPVPDGRSRPLYAPVPLTYHQTRILRLYAQGMVTEEIAAELACDTGTVRKVMSVARRNHRMVTTMQLVTHAYWANWFPGHREDAWLRDQPHPLGQGWISKDQPRLQAVAG